MPTEVKLLRHNLQRIPKVNYAHAALLIEKAQESHLVADVQVRLFHFETNDLDAYFWFINANLTGDEFVLIRAGYHSTGFLGWHKRYYVYLKSVPPPGPYLEIEIGPVTER